MTYDTSTRWPGVLAHHDDSCQSLSRGVCTCGPLAYRGVTDDPDTGSPVYGPPAPTVEAAHAWRTEHEVAMSSWRAAATRGDTVDEVIADFLEAAASGRALDAHGEPVDPDQLSDLRWSLQGHVAGEIGAMRISDVNGSELRRLVRHLDERGLSAARTRSVVTAVRALLRYAAQRGLVSWSAANTLILGDEDPHRPAPTTALRTLADPPAMTTASGSQSLDGLGSRLVPPGMVPDDVIWMVLKIVAVTFALIALVLAAESV